MQIRRTRMNTENCLQKQPNGSQEEKKKVHDLKKLEGISQENSIQ
jgi:hypothetical protein